MPIDHSSCDHPRTPAGRSACRRAGGPTKQRSETPVEARREARPSKTSRVTWPRRSGALKALADAPARVRVFIERCQELGLDVHEVHVEIGHSLEVFSHRGAGQVTWEGERVAWFTRIGWSSITRRVTSMVEVCKALGIEMEDD